MLPTGLVTEGVLGTACRGGASAAGAAAAAVGMCWLCAVHPALGLEQQCICPKGVLGQG